MPQTELAHTLNSVSLPELAASSLGMLRHKLGAQLKCSNHPSEDLPLYLIVQEFCRDPFKAGCQKLHSQHFNTNVPGEMLS